jgi:hypothetical protein
MAVLAAWRPNLGAAHLKKAAAGVPAALSLVVPLNRQILFF